MESKQERIHENVHEHLPEPSFKPSRVICVPIDHSPSSTHTVTFVVDKIINPSTDLVVLLNVRPPAFNDYSADLGFPYVIPAVDIDKAEQALREKSHQLLKQVASKFQLKNVHCRAISLRGEAREELTLKIEDLKPDFCVLGTRGLNTFSRLFLGSVSEHLVHHLKVPVMVVPMEGK